jgi:transposase
MATERLPMRKIREILRLKWTAGRRHRQIARALGVGVGTVSAVVRGAAAAGLEWERVAALSDAELEAALYGRPRRALRTPLPDPAAMDLELKKPGVTLQLLHVEYREHHPDGYGYTQFCDHYRRWKRTQRVVMRQVHRAGEKLFTDFAGQKPHWIDPETGAVHEAELFVAVLGASNFTYAEALESQRVPHWIAAHTRALEACGGVPAVVVPDQLKSAVTGPCRYEPTIQRTFEEWAAHYGTVIVPARPGHPRDKAKVEAGVLVAERWILARLRHQQFFSLAELNARIAELLADLNARVMRRYGQSRRALHDALDRPALRPLPVARFTYAEWSRVKVSIDYHVQLDHAYYSVPYQLAGTHLDARLAATTVELFQGGVRVAAHARATRRGQYRTDAAHMPSAHRAHRDWSPSRLIAWAAKVGPSTAALVEAILADRPHPEQGYRSCLGIMRLARGYGAERLEAAAARALAAKARSYKHVESILKTGLDRIAPRPATPTGSAAPPVIHEHLRGKDYYH